MLTQGSVERSNGPSEHFEFPGGIVSFQLAPPSRLTPAARPRAAPSVQRSCWKAAISRLGSVGSAATNVSTSLLGHTRWPDDFSCLATLSALHLANGSPSDTLVNGPSCAAAAADGVPRPSVAASAIAIAVVPTSAA